MASLWKSPFRTFLRVYVFYHYHAGYKLNSAVLFKLTAWDCWLLKEETKHFPYLLLMIWRLKLLYYFNINWLVKLDICQQEQVVWHDLQKTWTKLHEINENKIQTTLNTASPMARMKNVFCSVNYWLNQYENFVFLTIH